MLTFTTWRAKGTSFDARRFEDFLAQIPPEFRPVARPMVAFQTELLGLPPGSVPMALPDATYRGDPVRTSELLAHEQGMVLIYVRELLDELAHGSPTRSAIHEAAAPEISQAHRAFAHVLSVGADTSWAEPVIELANAILDRPLEAYLPLSRRFSELVDEGREPPDVPREDLLRAAEALKATAARRLAISIKSSGGLLVADMHKAAPESEREGLNALQALLEDAGIVESEVVVVCGRTNAQAMRVKTRTAIAEATAQGIRCGCGKALEHERVEEAVAITDLGRQLLDGSHWLTLVVLQDLWRLGVPQDRILIEQDPRTDELDCLADINGELVFFELKDKEFNLGSAYSFGAKIGIHRPDKSVVITTEHVGKDARDHFERAQLAELRSAPAYRASRQETREIRYIEGLEDLSLGLEMLMAEVHSRRAVGVLSDLMPGALSASDVVDAYLKLSVGSAVAPES